MFSNVDKYAEHFTFYVLYIKRASSFVKSTELVRGAGFEPGSSKILIY